MCTHANTENKHIVDITANLGRAYVSFIYLFIYLADDKKLPIYNH